MVPTVSFGFFENSHDRTGRTVTAPWSDLAARLCIHREGEKDGPAITCATFNGTRAKANLGARSLVALDVETNKRTGCVPPDPEVVIDLVRRKRLAAVLWTTHSHRPDDPRYRVVLPLSAPLDCAELADADPFITWSAAAELALCDVSDPSKFGASSLFYLARHPAGCETYRATMLEGDPINASQLRAVAIMTAENEAMSEAERAIHRARTEMPPAIAEAIQSFNAQNNLAHLFERYGYVRDGGRWKSRHQHGQGATTVLPDGMTWVSFSESDAAAGVGRRPAKRSSQCACFGDGFALFLAYEHQGNFRAALRAAQQAAGAVP